MNLLHLDYGQWREALDRIIAEARKWHDDLVSLEKYMGHDNFIKTLGAARMKAEDDFIADLRSRSDEAEQQE